MKKIAAVVVLLLLAGIAPAQTGKALTAKQSKSQRAGIAVCGGNPLLPTDGTSIFDFVDVSASSYYLVHLKGGHSYTAEVWDSFDAENGTSAQISFLDTGCNAITLLTSNVTNVDPDLSSNFSERLSWIQPADQDVIIAIANSDAANGYGYYVRMTDTTLYNSRWSTFSGYSTQFGLQNTTGASVSGTVTATDIVGSTTYTKTVTVAPGQVLFVFLGPGQDIDVPPNHAGSATFAFRGPASAIKADCYILNPAATVVVPTNFLAKATPH